MDNKTNLINNNIEKNISNEDIILAPPVELLDEAKEIERNTTAEEKFSFTLQYDSNQKEFLLSILQEAGAIVEAEDEKDHTFDTRMNMTQLAFVKRLDCVEKIMTNEGTNPFFMGKIKKNTSLDFEENVKRADENDASFAGATTYTVPTSDTIAMMAISEESEQVDSVAVASLAATTSCCPCPSNVTMATAKEISDESYTSGHISCPGSEQWFKFTATKTDYYTILTMGSLDTIGTLYDCSGNLLVEVDDYAPCGRINFRIIRSLTAGETYYIKVRLHGNSIGSYTLRVTERMFANYVTINKSIITLEKDVLYELPITPNYTYKGYNGAQPISGLSVSINPSDSHEQKVWWWEQYGGVLECFYGWDDDDDQYIHVRAKEKGSAKLYALDWDENGKRDECTVYVDCAPVAGINLDCSTKTVSLNDTEQLTAIILPSNALNKDVSWKSSNQNVVNVDINGVITGLKVGTAVVSATTDDGGFVASCVVKVDKRSKVLIEYDLEYSFEDEDYFNITFQNGKIWRSIGCDLALDENRSELPLWNKEDCYDSFTRPEQRYVDNIEQTFSAEELAFIYHLDPLGIEYYMKNHACDDKTLAEGLFFKDDVYKAIFGEPPSNRFYFTINDSGQVLYGKYEGWNRTQVYSNAETLFGSHVIFDWSNFWQSILTTLFESIPGVSYIQTGVEIYQALFHTGSFWGLYSNQAKSMVEDYITAPLNDIVAEKLGEKAHKCIGWVNNLIAMIRDASLSAFVIPNFNDITIYDTIEDQNNYRVVFNNLEDELSLKEIIDLCRG